MINLNVINQVNRILCGKGLLHATLNVSHPPKMLQVRLFSLNGKQSFWKAADARRRMLKITVSKPVGTTAFTVGKGAVAGGAACGLGALCYYGLGLSNEVGTIQTSRLWPQYVRDRIRTTYLYFGSSILLSAISAAYVFRSPVLFNLVTKNSWMAIGASIAALMGSGILTQSLEYSPGFGTKQLAWMLHSSLIGAVIAPMCLIGGPILLRAAIYTLGVVGGLSTVAVCAPSDKFLNIGGPLAMGLGVVFVSSIGTMFLPPTSAFGAGLMSISLYGGLLLFSGFLLYDTQKIIRRAETYPLYAPIPYDPINASISIYLDTINIFVRIATILASSGSNKRH